RGTRRFWFLPWVHALRESESGRAGGAAASAILARGPHYPLAGSGGPPTAGPGGGCANLSAGPAAGRGGSRHHPAIDLAGLLPAAAGARRLRAAQSQSRRLLANRLVDVFFAGVFVGVGNLDVVLG